MNTLLKTLCLGALIGTSGIALAQAQGMGMGMGMGMGGGGAMVKTNCKSEIAKYCADIPHKAGAVPACLNQHKDELSNACKGALARKGPGGGRGQGKGPGARWKNN
jgi:hypothetical protein